MKKNILGGYVVVFFIVFYTPLSLGYFKTVADAADVTSNGKMNIYGYCTPSHEVFRDNWFLPSLKDDFNVIIVTGEQISHTATFQSVGWNDTVLKKVDTMVDAIKQNWGKIFIFSDMDIQFFAPIQSLIEQAMIGKDMVIQRDCPQGSACSGFFACRGNEQMLAVWQKAKQIMIKQKCGDQQALNMVLQSDHNEKQILWDYLPIIFFGTGRFTGKIWVPGQRLYVPRGIVMHHANWTKGVSNKIQLLQYVKGIVSKRASEELIEVFEDNISMKEEMFF